MTLIASTSMKGWIGESHKIVVKTAIVTFTVQSVSSEAEPTLTFPFTCVRIFFTRGKYVTFVAITATVGVYWTKKEHKTYRSKKNKICEEEGKGGGRITKENLRFCLFVCLFVFLTKFSVTKKAEPNIINKSIYTKQRQWTTTNHADTS